MRWIKADAEDAAPAGALRRGRVCGLSIAGNDFARIAVRADDRPSPRGERIRHRLVGHMAQVEDHTLSRHRFQELEAQLCEPSWRPRAAAVACAAPRGA